MSSENAEQLCGEMFDFWMKPTIFDETKQFFKECPVPIYIVSNIDRADVLEAIKYHDLQPQDVITSEDAKSYKPRKEMGYLKSEDNIRNKNNYDNYNNKRNEDTITIGKYTVNKKYLEEFENKKFVNDTYAERIMNNFFNNNMRKQKQRRIEKFYA